MTFWIVDQIGATYAFADQAAAQAFADSELAGGAEDLSIGTIRADDLDVLFAVAEVACRKGTEFRVQLSACPEVSQ